MYNSDTRLAVTTEEQPILDFKVQPNPFQGEATIVLELDAPTEVSIQVFDQTGRLLEQLVRMEELPTGRQEFTLNADNLGHGMHYVRLQTAKEQIVRKVIVIRDGGFGSRDDD